MLIILIFLFSTFVSFSSQLSVDIIIVIIMYLLN
jgi:hypothetical protein